MNHSDSDLQFVLKYISNEQNREHLPAIKEVLLDSFKTEDDHDEDILNEDNRQFTALPIKYQNIFNLYKHQVASYWVPEEVNFEKDYDDFCELSSDEQKYIEMILAFFASADGIVNFNLGERFISEVTNSEIQMFYRYQSMMEDMHNRIYSSMLENLIKDKTKRDFLFNSIQNIPTIANMSNWAIKWISSPKSFSYRVVAFAIVEGIFFSGAFASLFWLEKYKNVNGNSQCRPFMNGLLKSNRFISRDEGLHCIFACEIYNLLTHKLTDEQVHGIFIEGVDIAVEFMRDVLQVNLIGMNFILMEQYIKYIADRLLRLLNHTKLYNVTNPFTFMETAGLDDKSNFFETEPHEYQNANILNNVQKDNACINFDIHF